MKYYTFVECVEGSTILEYNTMSEDEIIKEYWDHWYGKMCEKFGKDHVDQNYTKQDCIDDWVVVYWAVESDSEGN